MPKHSSIKKGANLNFYYHLWFEFWCFLWALGNSKMHLTKSFIGGPLRYFEKRFLISNFCDAHFFSQIFATIIFFFSSQFFATLILHSKVSKTCTFANLRYALHYISERLSISSSHNLDSSRHVWRISKFFWSLHVLLHWKKKTLFFIKSQFVTCNYVYLACSEKYPRPFCIWSQKTGTCSTSTCTLLVKGTPNFSYAFLNLAMSNLKEGNNSWPKQLFLTSLKRLRASTYFPSLLGIWDLNLSSFSSKFLQAFPFIWQFR